MASKIFNVPESEIETYRTDKNAEFMRFVGKQSVLGFGYGMGEDKFRDRCEFLGVAISYSLALKSKQIYRKERKKIVRFWYALEAAAVDTLITKRPHKCGKVTFRKEENRLYCRLPSGRSLCYQDAQLDEDGKIVYMSVESQSKKWLRTHTWGGKLTENIVQGLCRDLLAMAMIRLEREGFPIVLHVHDEPVAEVDPQDADLEKFERLLCQAPWWAKGFPIKSEGWIGKRYRKG